MISFLLGIARVLRLFKVHVRRKIRSLKQERKSLGSGLLFSIFTSTIAFALYIFIQAFRGHIFYDFPESLILIGLFTLLLVLSKIAWRLNPTPRFLTRKEVTYASFLTTISLFQLLSLILLVAVFLFASHRVPQMTPFNLGVMALAGLLCYRSERQADERLGRGPIDQQYLKRFLVAMSFTNLTMIVTIFTLS